GGHGDGEPADCGRRLSRALRRSQRLELRAARAGRLRARVLYDRQDRLHAADVRRGLMDLTAFKALTFDCYGTLIDWEGGILAGPKPWAAASGHKLTDDQILEAFGEAESACEVATPSKLYPGILADTMKALAKHWSISASEAQAAEFGRSVPRWPAFPDS